MNIIKEMREVSQQRKPNAKGKMVWGGHWFNTLFVRHFSIYITWLFVKLGISANFVTFLMISTALAGVALCVPHIWWLNIPGFFLLFMAEVFDCVDGEIARWTRKSSLRGYYLDQVSHVLCNAPLSMMFALHMYVLGGRIHYLILAFLTYAAAQCRLGLRDVFLVTLTKVSPDNNQEQGGNVPSRTKSQEHPGGLRKTKKAVTRLVYLFTDISVIRLTAFFCIFLTYASIVKPLIFFSWFYAIFWVVRIFGEIANKFAFVLPKVQHIKKV